MTEEQRLRKFLADVACAAERARRGGEEERAARLREKAREVAREYDALEGTDLEYHLREPESG